MSLLGVQVCPGVPPSGATEGELPFCVHFRGSDWELLVTRGSGRRLGLEPGLAWQTVQG